MSTENQAPPVYGVWNGQVFDFRNGAKTGENFLNELPDMSEFASKGVRALIADRGFLVYDAKTDLAGIFQKYLKRAAEESCGKCAPCRIGTVHLEKLLGARDFSAEKVAAMETLAVQIASTSLCGHGKSCCRAIISALAHFADEFRSAKADDNLICSTYVTAPCIEACPAKVDVPRYIDYISDDRPLHAFTVLTENYPEVASCGRVCVKFCEDACRRRFAEGAVSIKALKRYCADKADRNLNELFTPDLILQTDVAGKRVAVIGAGPSGVTCAYHLLRNGIKVDLYEAQDVSGGMIVSGIPSYRLPKEIVKRETQTIIEDMGGRFFFKKALGKDFTVESLKADGYDAIFVAIGAGAVNNLPGSENAKEGYYSSIGYLWQIQHLVEEGKATDLNPGEVVVVGGGNVAMDCVRSAIRTGATNVHLVYRRALDDMSAHEEEVVAGQTEGVNFHFMMNPISLVTDENGKVTGIKLVKMRKKPDDPKKLEEVPGSEFILPCSTAIAAIGQKVDRGLLESEKIPTDRWGCIEVDPDSMMTSVDGIFSGGDCVLGPKTMIEAMAQGEKAAKGIRDYLRGTKRQKTLSAMMHDFITDNELMANEKIRRSLMTKERTEVTEIGLEDRVSSFNEVELVMTRDEAFHESARCLRCYRMYSVVTEQAI